MISHIRRIVHRLYCSEGPGRARVDSSFKAPPHDRKGAQIRVTPIIYMLIKPSTSSAGRRAHPWSREKSATDWYTLKLSLWWWQLRWDSLQRLRESVRRGPTAFVKTLLQKMTWTTVKRTVFSRRLCKASDQSTGTLHLYISLVHTMSTGYSFVAFYSQLPQSHFAKRRRHSCRCL